MFGELYIEEFVMGEENSEVAILFCVVEKSYNYVFGDDLLPQSPLGRGYKLQTLTSAYI